jgi:CheY-like chemotaxis protein
LRDVTDDEPRDVPPAVGHRNETILVVEDDPDVRSYIAEILNELKYSVVQSADAETALEMCSDKTTKIDLLLTDVVLPGIDGRQLAEEMKKLRPTIKVLFMTGYSRNAIVHQGRLDRGVELIQKPITHSELSERIRGLLDAGPRSAADDELR